MSADEPQRKAPLGVRALNRVGGALARRGRKRPDLAPQTLLAAARRRARSDFDDSAALEPLSILVEDLESDARLTTVGRMVARGTLVDLLANRIDVAGTVAANPEIEQHEIRRPIFVVGLPRTGTTLLYKLLASDPAARAPLYWESLWPVLRPGRHRDARRRRARRQVRGLNRLSPDLRVIHPVDPLGVEEDLMLQAITLRSPFFHMFWDAPRYWQWLRERPEADIAEAYRHYRTILRCLEAAPPKERHAPTSHWVLKTPAHQLFVSELLATFPDAVVVETIRPLTTVVPSLASLASAFRRISSDDADPHSAGRQALDFTVAALERMTAARTAHPERFLRVEFRTLVDDPIGTVTGVYDRLGLPVTDEMQARMSAWIAENPRDKHGVHRYTLEQFGLDEALIRERTGAYERSLGPGSTAF